MIANTTYELTDIERAEFVMLETRIKEGLALFYKVGDALLTIRDKRLYRDDYPNFEAYCVNRWRMGRRYANMLIAAAAVYENLEQGTTVPLPTRETQVRPLTPLEPEEQRLAWQVVNLVAKELNVEPNQPLAKKIASVITTGIVTETLDGEIMLTEAAKNTFVQDAYEARQRQKEHMNADKPKPVIAEATYTPYGLEFTDAAPVLKSGVKYRVLFYEVTD